MKKVSDYQREELLEAVLLYERNVTVNAQWTSEGGSFEIGEGSSFPKMARELDLDERDLQEFLDSAPCTVMMARNYEIVDPPEWVKAVVDKVESRFFNETIAQSVRNQVQSYLLDNKPVGPILCKVGTEFKSNFHFPVPNEKSKVWIPTQEDIDAANEALRAMESHANT